MNIEKHLPKLIEFAKLIPPIKSSRLVAVLFKKNNVVCWGTNSYKTHPLQKKYAKNGHAIYLHAEVTCVKNALKKGFSIDEISECEMLIVRVCRKENSDEFKQALAKPCMGCQRCLADFGLRKVYYTCDTVGVVEL